MQKAAKNRRLPAGEGWEQAGASCRVSGWWQLWKTGAVVAPAGTHAWHQLLGGQRGQPQGAARETIIFVLEGGGRVEKNMRDGMKTSEESKVRGPNLPQLPMSSATGLAGATLSKHGRGRWMLSQKQGCKPTQNAHDTGKEKYYSHI